LIIDGIKRYKKKAKEKRGGKKMLTKLQKRDERGFTLIELMIVIAIIGILAAIAIPQFSAYRMRSYNAAAQADLRNAATAQEAYYVDFSGYVADPVANLVGQTYGLYMSSNVNLSGTGGSNAYTMTSFNTKGNKTYSLTGPGGTIE
jgi:type IV pilus assembly protein PilA